MTSIDALVPVNERESESSRRAGAGTVTAWLDPVGFSRSSRAVLMIVREFGAQNIEIVEPERGEQAHKGGSEVSPDEC